MNVKIIAQTTDYIVVQKPACMLSQSDISKDSENVVDIITQKLNKPLHLLTRLDRPVGGILLLSKKKSFTKYYLRQQSEDLVKKEYIAIIEGQLDVESADWSTIWCMIRKKEKHLFRISH